MKPMLFVTGNSDISWILPLSWFLKSNNFVPESSLSISVLSLSLSCLCPRKVKNKWYLFFFSSLLAEAYNGLPFPFSVERMETEYAASGAPYGLTFLASAFEVKMVTREKNIFGSKPKKRTFLSVLALFFSWCWFLSESSSVPLIHHIWRWNHLCKFFSSPHPWL